MEEPIFTTTAHTIGKVTYYIISEPSEKARENLDKKLEKLIRKDLCGLSGCQERRKHVTAR